MTEETVETKEPKETRAIYEKNTKYRKPEVEDLVVDMRDKGNSWEEIRNVLSSKIDEPKLAISTTKRIYNRAMSKTITINKRAGKKYKDHTESLDKMQSQIIKGLGRYVNAVDKLSEQLDNAVEDNSMTALKAYGIFLKTAPAVKSICSSVMDFMKFSIDQQDKINVQQEELIYSDDQINEKIAVVLEKLKEEGKIIWLKEKL